MTGIQFQLLYWESVDEYDDDDEKNYYKIKLFGRTKDNKSVYLEVTDFKPFFYVEIKKEWQPNVIKKFIQIVQDYMVYPKDKVNGLIMKDNYVVEKHKFNGFTDKEKFNFLELSFHDYSSFKAYQKVFKKKRNYYGISRDPLKFKTYESGLDPMLRFMHIQQIDAMGWVKINTYKKFEDNPTICDINITAKWTDIIPYKSTEIAKFKIMSFDIECNSCDGSFPQAQRDSDMIIQIGLTMSYLGETNCYYNHLLSLKSTDNIDGVVVEWFEHEKDLLLSFTKAIKNLDPDIIIGYNIFGFDFKYIKQRAEKLGIYDSFIKLSRVKYEKSEYIVKQLASAALGDNILEYFKMTGRVIADLMKIVQKDYTTLEQYKLDYVASYFIKGNITNYTIEQSLIKMTVTNINELKEGSYISVFTNNSIMDEKLGGKYIIKQLVDNTITIDSNELVDLIKECDTTNKFFWCLNKDDISPKEIFDGFKKTSKDRQKIGKYCIQDCALCNRLIEKLKIIVNGIGMANVCNVPLSYLFFRGQGIKIFSLVSKQCRLENYLIPDKKYKPSVFLSDNDKKLEKFITKINRNENDSDIDTDDDTGYEGAMVFPPKKGVYMTPIIVLDYASLYPNTMIYKNISHESLVIDNQYDNLPDYNYHVVSFKNETDDKETICKFAEHKNGNKAIIPKILINLLTARKQYKKMMDDCKDQQLRSVYNGMQLAYKVVANSVYGQTGASTSNIFKKEIAASTTAVGRNMLIFAKDFVEITLAKILRYVYENKQDLYEKYMNELELNISDENKNKFMKTVYDDLKLCVNDYKTDPQIIYGDTDSVFFTLNLMKNNVKLLDKQALQISIRCGQIASKLICTLLKSPMAMEYEKVLWPFMILTKKRYVGNLYETDPNKYYQKNMGIVLKRRDNAPIVKLVCGRIIDQILNKRDKKGSVDYTRTVLNDIVNKRYPLSKFIITKSLRGNYKKRLQIAHAVLADRMTERDKGNAPQLNDRIPYVYIETKKKTKLQGDKIEHPDYVIKNNLNVDYLFYITNQIMKPAIQFLELVADNPHALFKDYIIREENKQKKMIPIEFYLNNNNSDDETDKIDLLTFSIS